MSWAGAAIGATSDMIGGFIKLSAAKKAAKKNREFQERMYKNRFTYTMEDMRRAGLNPILAAGMGLGGGGSPSGSMAATPNFPTGGAVAGLSAGSTAAKVSTEKDLMRKQGLAADAQANASSAVAAKSAAEGNLVTQLTPHTVTSARRQATEDNLITNHLNTPAGMGTAIGRFTEPKVPGAGLVGGAMTQTGAQISKGVSSAKGWWQANRQKIFDWVRRELIR